MPPLPPTDAQTLALMALAATVRDQPLAERFLSLSGMSAPELRRRAADPALLAGLLRFLAANEPDLVAVARMIETEPARLVEALEALEQ